MNTYTSDDVAKAHEECPSGLCDITDECHFRYQLTEGEQGWLDWIGDRYSVATELWKGYQEDDDGTATVLIDTYAIGEALKNEGLDRAPCLSEDTELAYLIWFIGPNEYDTEE